MSDSLFLAWAAGFFDGEGCVLVSAAKGRTKEYYGLFVTITQQNPSALYLIRDRFGGTVSVDRSAASPSFVRKNGAMLVWRWRAQSLTAMDFLESVAPYAVVKKEQIRIAMEYPDIGVQYRRGNPVPDSIREARRKIMYALREARQQDKVKAVADV